MRQASELAARHGALFFIAFYTTTVVTMPTQSSAIAVKICRQAALLSAILILAGCSWLQKSETDASVPAVGLEIPADVDAVLPANSVLQAYTASGPMRVEAGADSLRIFSWEDARRGIAAEPRETIFAGSMGKGLHFDGKPPIWEPYEGIEKLHYEENSRNFGVPMDAKIWTQIRRLNFSYNNNGLALGWKTDGDTLYVEVWQFYVNGEKPDALPGAVDNNIALTKK